MARKSEPTDVVVTRRTKPASDPAAREKQLTQLAVDLAEKQLRDGTASPSIINHYLKIASTRETIEKEILERQAELIKAKASAINSDRDVKQLTENAIAAMKNYAGTGG